MSVVTVATKTEAAVALDAHSWTQELDETPEQLRERVRAAVLKALPGVLEPGVGKCVELVMQAIASPPTKRRIHSVTLGGLRIGADWDLDRAVEFVEAADDVFWTDDMLRHDLIVRGGGRVIAFDVPRPGREER